MSTRPYPTSDPVKQLYEWGRANQRTSPVSRDEQAGVWHVFSHADAKRVISDWKVFSSDFAKDFSTAAGRLFAGNFAIMDPPTHTRLRSLVSKAFTPAMVAGLAAKVRSLCDELFDRLPPDGPWDFVREFAFPLPATVIAHLVGIPPEDQELFGHWVDWQASSATVQEGADDVDSLPSRITECLRGHIDNSRSHPTDDLLSRLVTVRLDGGGLTDEEIIGLVTLLLVGGFVTTLSLLSSCVLCLDRNPGSAGRLAADPSLLPSAIEEVLRYRPPFARVMRQTAREVSLSGVTIPAGELVVPWLTTANRDPEVFADPERFDIGRQPNPHLSFGHGIHFCLGMPLARLEARIAMERMLDRFEAVRVVPGADVRSHDPWAGVLSVRQLPVDFIARPMPEGQSSCAR